MPKYFEFKVSGYFLYYTSHCVIEAMHVHASDKKLTEVGSAKFFVKGNGDTVVKARAYLTIKIYVLYVNLSRIIIRKCIFVGQR